MTNSKPYNTIQFPSKDGLTITADMYAIPKPKDYILLCHRSHCNRAEYRETAPKPNALGYSCLAIDQRSGMKVFGETNETSTLAKQKGLATGYLDAKPDIKAAVDFLYEKNNKQPIIILGSSYSAALALLIAAKTDKIKAVVTFSPGEHLKGINLAEEIKSLDKPTFITAAKKEIEEASQVVRHVNSSHITQFKPKVEGFHGSKTLWKSVKGYESYWRASEKFLLSLL